MLTTKFKIGDIVLIRDDYYLVENITISRNNIGCKSVSYTCVTIDSSHLYYADRLYKKEINEKILLNANINYKERQNIYHDVDLKVGDIYYLEIKNEICPCRLTRIEIIGKAYIQTSVYDYEYIELSKYTYINCYFLIKDIHPTTRDYKNMKFKTEKEFLIQELKKKIVLL